MGHLREKDADPSAAAAAAAGVRAARPEASAFLGVVIPGEIGVILGGVLANQHKLPLAAVLVAGIIGAIRGDTIGYGLVTGGKASLVAPWVNWGIDRQSARWRPGSARCARRSSTRPGSRRADRTRDRAAKWPRCSPGPPPGPPQPGPADLHPWMCRDDVEVGSCADRRPARPVDDRPSQSLTTFPFGEGLGDDRARRLDGGRPVHRHPAPDLVVLAAAPQIAGVCRYQRLQPDVVAVTCHRLEPVRGHPSA